MPEGPNSPSPTRFGFLLLDEFTLISLSSAIEPLRMANRVLQRELYTWETCSESGAAVAASDGLSVIVDRALDDPALLERLDAIIVCGGLNVEHHASQRILRWLRQAARKQRTLGAICTGSYALAAAGLLDGYRCSIHWENLASLANGFPGVVVNRAVFSLDRDRMTCSGGTTPVDMMLHLITRRCGAEVSAAVAEQFIYERIRRENDQQKVPLKHVIGQRSSPLVAAVEFMEANIREPIRLAELAGFVGVSPRQLQRLFQRHLGCTPRHYYLQLRLHRARELLQQTHLDLAAIAELTGFATASQLSRSFRDHFGHPPGQERLPSTHTGHPRGNQPGSRALTA